MNPKLLPGLAFVLSSVLLGCGKTERQQSQTNQPKAESATAIDSKPPEQPPRSTVEKPLSNTEATIATIRKAGEPTTLAELDAWYPQVPADQNAAPLYLAAFAAITETNAAAPAFVALNQKALGLLHQAGTRPKCRYPIDLNDGFKTKLPHLVSVKWSAQLMQQEANLFAIKGQMEQATRSLLTGLAVSRALESEPLSISQLVRLRGIELTVTGLELALNRKPFTEAQMIQLSAALQAAEENDETAILRCLIGERGSGLAVFQSPEGFRAILNATEELAAAATPEINQMMEGHQKGPRLQADLAYYLDRMENIILAAKSRYPDRVHKAKAWGGDLIVGKQSNYYLSAMLLPVLEQVVVKSGVAVAELRVAQTALAVERYRLANRNQLPESLSQLVPQYLKAIPADPFSWQPLRYKKNAPKGYTVYSVGPDEQDDKGLHKPAKIYKGFRYDLALTVAR